MFKKWLLLGMMGYLFCTVSYAEEAKSANSFTMTTSSFLDEGMLPVVYTCDGKDVPPAFEWTGIPAKTQTFAMIMSDPDAPGGTFYHWIVFNIPAKTTKLEEASQTIPAGALAGTNNFGKKQYNGPCPPKGTAHTYYFTIYALDNKLSLPAGAAGEEVIKSMDTHILGTAKVTAVYSRWFN